MSLRSSIQEYLDGNWHLVSRDLDQDLYDLTGLHYDKLTPYFYAPVAQNQGNNLREQEWLFCLFYKNFVTNLNLYKGRFTMPITELISTMVTNHLAPLPSKNAYLDPGSGSILLQLLIASALGILVVLRTSWSRIKNLFRRDSLDEQDQESDER